MALSDPQSVTINAVANSLPRVSTGQNVSEYRKDDGNVILAISHQYGRRTRRAVRLQHKKIAADPLTAGINVEASMSVTLVIDTPKTAFYTNTEAKQIADALLAYLTASSGAKVTSVLGGES
nr:MAG: hypothetical protein 2 [Leviviridae sp.]